MKNKTQHVNIHSGHIYLEASAPLTALGSCCRRDGAAVLFIFYTYLFLSVLFKAGD